MNHGVPARPAHPRRRIGGTFAVGTVVALLLTLAGFAGPSQAAQTTGVDFWLAFDSNYTSGAQLTLFISGGTATSGTVTPMGSAGIPFSVTPGAVTSVPIDTSQMIDQIDVVQDKGIHVTAGAPVSVYGLNRIPQTTDAYLGIPTDALGTRYRTLAYDPAGLAGTPAGFGIVGTQDGTTVTIVPSVDALTHPAGVPFDIVLNQGQTYQLGVENADLSGSVITASAPISVFGYGECLNVPPEYAYCDHIVEQLPPTSAWGTSFLAARLANRAAGDTYRVLADEDGTVVTVDGAQVATLNAGQFYEAVLPAGVDTPGNAGIAITTSKPALVAQYSNGTEYDDVVSDPFMMLIPPFEQFLSSYTVTTPASGFETNFINVVVPNGSTGTFQLDGSGIDPAAFAPIGSSGFSSAQLQVALGSHTLSAGAGFGAFVYGFADDDSYGYPGGYNLSPVADAAALTLDQSAYSALVGTDICPVATVTNAQGQALADVTVTFVVDTPAVNLTAVTNASGQASVCFASDTVITGNLTASAGLSIGTLTAQATVAWAEPATTTTTAPPASQPAVVVTARPTFTG